MEDNSSDSDDSFTTSAGTVDSSDEDSSTVIVISSDSNQSTDYFSTGTDSTDSSSDSSDTSIDSHTGGFATDTGSFSGAEGADVEEVAMEIESSASNSPEPVLQRLPAPRFEVADPPADLPEVPLAPVLVGDAIVPEEPQPGPSVTVKPAEGEGAAKNTLKRPASALLDDSDDDNGQRCPICLDSWSGTGEHRLCSLACGHLFGKSCIERWMKKGGSGKRCPQCNNPCKARDIRPLYASAVKVKEVAEEERLAQQLQQALKEKRELELRLLRTELKVAQLEKKEEEPVRPTVIVPTAPGKYVFQLAKEVPIGEKGGGRVMSFCAWATQLSVSQASKMCGYGLMRVSCERDFSVQTLESLHGKMIRDIAYYPGQQNSLLLTASLDRSAKLVDYRCNLAVQTYRVQAPLWSCCWDLTGCATDCHLVTLGLTTGLVARFDIRKVTLDPVAVLGKREGDQAAAASTPVSSLVSLPPGYCAALPRGGLIASQLTTCKLYVGDQDREGVVLPFLPPILCLRSEPESGHLLVSSRATSTRPTTHTVFRVSRENNVAPADIFENVLSLQGANRQSLLTRPCITTLCDREMVVISNHEESRTVPIWSVGTGNQINSLPTREDVLDICSMNVNNTKYLSLLTDKKLAIYKFKL